MKSTDSHWEHVCERCGRCCFEKYDYNNRIYYTRNTCKFLDLVTKTCLVYHERQKRQPECACLTPELVRAGILPKDCPYINYVDESEGKG